MSDTAVAKSQHDELARQLLPSGVAPELRTDKRTFGERLADSVAAVGGSWGFIIAFGRV